MTYLNGRTAGLLVLCGVLTLSSCTCENTIRKMVSNPTPGNKARKHWDDAGESSQPTEEEPNDAREQATLVRLGNELRPVEGDVSSGSDTDWFSLKTESKEPWLMTVRVEALSKDFDPVVDVELEESDGEVISYDTVGVGETEEIRHLAVSSDAQRLAIRAAEGGDGGAYRMSLEKQLSGGAVEREPNDIRKSATLFEFPGEFQGFFGRPGDRDWFYALRGEFEPGIYQVTATPTGQFPYTYELYTGRSATEPYLTRQVPPEERALIPNLRIPDKLDGLWFRFEAGEKFSAKTGYRLRAVEHPPVDDAILEGEPNDAADDAIELMVGETTRGYLHSPTDTDRFDLAVGREHPSQEPAASSDAGAGETEEQKDTTSGEEEAADTGTDTDGGDDPDAGSVEPVYVPPIERVARKESPEHVVQVGLKPMAKSDRLALLWWRDGEAEEGAEPAAIEANEEGESVKICNHPVDRGIMRLGVRGAKIEQKQLRGDFTYELAAVDIASKVDGLEIEPNDEREEADRLDFGVSRTGYIARSGDRDVYAFGIPNPRKMEALAEQQRRLEQAAGESDDGAPSEPAVDDSADAGVSKEDSADAGDTGSEPVEPPEPVGVKIALQGNQLNLGFEVLDGQGGLVARVDRSGPGANEKTEIDLPPGLYFVVVESNRGFECRPYTLSVDRKE
jgi:hypothetical protein